MQQGREVSGNGAARCWQACCQRWSENPANSSPQRSWRHAGKRSVVPDSGHFELHTPFMGFCLFQSLTTDCNRSFKTALQTQPRWLSPSWTWPASACLHGWTTPASLNTPRKWVVLLSVPSLLYFSSDFFQFCVCADYMIGYYIFLKKTLLLWKQTSQHF